MAPQSRRPLLFLFDYDGTLTDFKKNPKHSRISASTRALLHRLQRKHPVVLVTGRYVEQLRKLSGLKTFSIIGTHGFEAYRLPKGLRFVPLAMEKRYKKEASAIWSAVKGLPQSFPGIHIEKKPFSSTLHYRGTRLSPKKITEMRKTFIHLCRQTITPGLWSFQKGKEMLEVLPKGFSKGKSVRSLLKYFPNHLAVSAGDDVADILVFKAVGKKGVKIAVGNRIPRKHYDIQFKSPKQLIAWLVTVCKKY